MWKWAGCFIACGVVASFSFVTQAADTPGGFSYQGVLTGGDGRIVQDDVYQVRFNVFDAPMNGYSLFEQTVSVGVTNGLYNVILSSDAAGVNLVDVFTSGAQRFMEVTLLSGGDVSSPVTLTPRQQIASVPYALVARNIFEPPPEDPPWSILINLSGASNFNISTSLTGVPPGLQGISLVHADGERNFRINGSLTVAESFGHGSSPVTVLVHLGPDGSVLDPVILKQQIIYFLDTDCYTSLVLPNVLIQAPSADDKLTIELDALEDKDVKLWRSTTNYQWVNFIEIYEDRK